jgi:hypothetical protein
VVAADLLGIDLDNTIIGYDGLMHSLAVEQGVITPAVPATKRDVCAAVRATPDGENCWQRLQGEVYGPRIRDAVPMAGVQTAVADIVRAGIRVAIVSHKTRRAAQGDGTDLQEAALGWLDTHGLFRAGLSRGDVHFTATALDKVARIGELGCRWFVDDLLDILIDPRFPSRTEALWLNAAGGDAPARVRSVPTWDAVTRHVLACCA